MSMSRQQTYRSRQSAYRSPGLSRRRERGMTLLELLVVLAVVGLLMALGVRGVRWLRSSSLRETTTDIAAVLRGSYNLATMSATHHRVVFDLDAQTYRVEVCEGEVVLTRSEREEVADPDSEDEQGGREGAEAEAAGAAAKAGLRGGLPGLGGGLPGLPPGLMPRPGAGGDIPSEILGAGSLEEATRLAGDLAGSSVGAARCSPADVELGDSKGRGAERRLPKEDGLRITRMFVQHLEGEQREGKVYVNFFPLGYAEKAAIEVADEDGTTYTLLVHALTGRVEFRSGRVEPEEHLLERADGEEVEER
jgi:prepilin-type N-terminal cleavage/methylation domain-containing protein